LPREEVGDRHVLLRVHHPVGCPHHPWDVPARAELELLRPVRVLGSEQARSAEQRERLGELLGQMAEYSASGVLAEARAAGNPFGPLLSRRAAGPPREDALHTFLRKDGNGALLRGREPVPHHVRGADQDVLAVDLQPQVHRQHPGIFFQYLTWPRLLPPNRSITTTTSSG